MKPNSTKSSVFSRLEIPGSYIANFVEQFFVFLSKNLKNFVTFSDFVALFTKIVEVSLRLDRKLKGGSLNHFELT